jgi:hypothetical protein
MYEKRNEVKNVLVELAKERISSTVSKEKA